MRRLAAALVVLSMLLAACGGGGDAVRDYVAQTYDVLSREDDELEARSDDDVDTVAADLTGRFDARDRLDEPTGTFFRTGDDFVAVRPDPAGGTLISVDSDERGSSRWVGIIGPVFLPGGRFGGAGEGVRGGGPGAGK